MRRGMRTRMGAAALSICSLAMARPPVAGAQEADDAEAGEAIETLEGDASTVAGEVRLAGGEDVGALCAELRVGGADTDRAVAGLYSMKLPSSAFAFTAYDGHRARLGIDGARGFRGKGGAYELVLNDLAGARRGKGLDLAVPATAAEASSMAKGLKAGTLSLTIWFRVADVDKPCASLHTTDGDGTRLAIDPLAFELAQGSERLASAETGDFAALKQVRPQRAPRVVVSPPMRTKGGKAADAVAKVAVALEPSVLGCYREGLTRDDALRGSLVVGMVLDSGGKVTEARPEIDGLGDKTVVGCVVGEIKATRFPKGHADRFSVPIKFALADQ
jgi:hypothetical protein